MYLEPGNTWRLSTSDGMVENRTRDPFLALWVPDFFMRRASRGGGLVADVPQALYTTSAEPISMSCTSAASGGRFREKMPRRSS
jgi:hypothetical protein